MKKIWQTLKQIFKKFQSYSFWVSLCGAIVLLVTALGKAFNFSVENEVVENVIMSIAGVLVVLGLVASPSEAGTADENGIKEDSSEEISEEKLSTEVTETEISTKNSEESEENVENEDENEIND